MGYSLAGDWEMAHYVSNITISKCPRSTPPIMGIYCTAETTGEEYHGHSGSSQDSSSGAGSGSGQVDDNAGALRLQIKRDWDQYSEEVCPYDAPWLYDSDDLDKASWLPKEGHTWQEAGAAWLDEISIEIETDIENAEYDREHGLSDDENDTEDDK